jgi:hypothetical protein
MIRVRAGWRRENDKLRHFAAYRCHLSRIQPDRLLVPNLPPRPGGILREPQTNRDVVADVDVADDQAIVLAKTGIDTALVMRASVIH